MQIIFSVNSAATLRIYFPSIENANSTLFGAPPNAPA
jgi:hypothetical protein